MHPSASSLSRFGVRFAVLGLVAVSASACSSTDRFAYDPFANPFNGSKTASNERGPSTTGSLADSSGPISRAPTSRVSSEPLPPPSNYGSASASPAYAPAAPSYPSYSQAPSPSPSYFAAPARQDYSTASYPAAPARSYEQGGRTVVVQYGDTPYSLGQRHGVPASKILSANKLAQGSTLSPGQRIVIPSSANQAAGSRAVASAETPAPRIPSRAAAGRGGSHTVASGETLFSVARQYGVPAGQLASANGYTLDQKVRVGETLTLPAGASAGTATASSSRALGAPPAALGSTRPSSAEPAPVVAQAPAAAAPVRAAPPVQAAAPAAEEPKFQKAVASTEPKPATKSDDADEAPRTASSGADFRWPVRGRVISGFGSKPNGATNDGLNLSVPEGTAVKAAEGGVVAYAGNELKGFGNLVLIRHQGEWVTAYAHASEILVKRGDVVRRGQVIAKSGKTGNVSAPQLHFEVRRGATPVDPMSHLPAG